MGGSAKAAEHPPLNLRNLALRLAGATDAGWQRTLLVDDIAHYEFDLRVGSGPYDVIGLHRVVRESSPQVPAVLPKAIFLAHGIIADFTATFLTGAVPGRDPR